MINALYTDIITNSLAGIENSTKPKFVGDIGITVSFSHQISDNFRVSMSGDKNRIKCDLTTESIT